MTAQSHSFAALAAFAGLARLWLPGGAAISTLIGPRARPLAIVATMLALRGPAQFTGAAEAEEPPAGLAEEPVVRDVAGRRGWHHLAAMAVPAFAVPLLLGERRPPGVTLTTGAAGPLVAVLLDRLPSLPMP